MSFSYKTSKRPLFTFGHNKKINDMITRIATVGVYVDDQKKAEDFWIDKVGFEVWDRKDMGNGSSWLEVAPKGAPTALVLYPKKLMTNYAELKPSIVFYCS